MDLEMNIADVSHAEATTFNIGDSNILRKVITFERRGGPDYCTPNRNMIGGELLDLNL